MRLNTPVPLCRAWRRAAPFAWQRERALREADYCFSCKAGVTNGRPVSVALRAKQH